MLLSPDERLRGEEAGWRLRPCASRKYTRYVLSCVVKRLHVAGTPGVSLTVYRSGRGGILPGTVRPEGLRKVTESFSRVC